MHQEPLPSVSARQLAALLAAPPEALQLIDVREPEEVAIAALPNFTVLPLSQSAQWSAEIHQRLNPTAPTYVLCHHGVRSAQMCHWLRSQGFENVTNISGGIDAYATEVDTTIPRY
ncbi:MAG: rhodanese-like domain-containing protein [Cyanobacteria bacterium P01_G01_bin.54]